MFCSWKLSLSIGVFVLPVSVVVSEEINRKNYFQLSLRIYCNTDRLTLDFVSCSAYNKTPKEGFRKMRMLVNIIHEIIAKMVSKTSPLTFAQKQEDNIPGFDWFSKTYKQCPS